MIFTLACPSALMDDANAFVATLGGSVADLTTFRRANWRDSDGATYAAVSFETSPDWRTKAQAVLERPMWDADNHINMAGARLAQAALSFWVVGEVGALPQASPHTFSAIGGMPGLDALAAMGLTQVEEFALP